MGKLSVYSVLTVISLTAIVTMVVLVSSDLGKNEPVIAEGLPNYTINGVTDLEGNFFISFVYSKNLIMLDGKGNIVWSMHKDPGPDGVQAGCWDFKKHVVARSWARLTSPSSRRSQRSARELLTAPRRLT